MLALPGHRRRVSQRGLVGLRDLFADPAFDETRRQASQIMDHLRRHGPFEPHRLLLEDLEYTAMPAPDKTG
jgi:fructose 1,6-bisphosphatase